MNTHTSDGLSATQTTFDVAAFFAAGTMIERVDMLNRVAKRRLYSHHLAMLWADCLNARNHTLSAPERVRLVKEILLLSPNNEGAQAMADHILQGQEPLANPNEPVFMVVSCRKYLAKAHALLADLRRKGALAWVVLGDPSLKAAQWSEDACTLPVEDSYEHLALKVIMGIEALRERFGSCAVVKIDDDCKLAPNFDLEQFRAFARSQDYVGVAVEQPCHDRLWHHGKTSKPMGVYTRRYRGPWARGACYLLSARAAGLVAREALMYPGEFACEYYEDKAMGDFMRVQGLHLHRLACEAQWGIEVDLNERFDPQAPAATSPQPGQQQAPNHVQEQLHHRMHEAAQDPMHEATQGSGQTQNGQAPVSPSPTQARDGVPTPSLALKGEAVFAPFGQALPGEPNPLPQRPMPAMPALTPETTRPAAVSRQRIPKILHLTWVGDDSKRPDNCIRTWVQHNPDWTIKVWGNDDLREREWVNARHIRAMWNRELNGVADLMRWEILYAEGGIVVDADSVCVRALDDWLLEAEAIACWENEITRPRLIGCNMVGAVAGNPFIGQIIQDLHAQPTVVHDMAWKTVGPLCLTTAYFKYRYTGLTILPSHFFIPDHFSGVHYEGGGIVYAKQEWASTHRAYDSLHLKQVA